VDSLAEKLSYLLRHPELWPDLGRAGRKRVEEQYDIERLNDQLVIIYQRLLNHGFE
jgi:colanic acid/amylovoran biosynthesis glycosyltransferase